MKNHELNFLTDVLGPVIVSLVASWLIFATAGVLIKAVNEASQIYQEQSACVAEYIPLGIERINIETIVIYGKGDCYVKHD